MRSFWRQFHSFSVTLGLGLSLLATANSPAKAIISTCVEGCANQLAGDLTDCKYWLEPVNDDIEMYGYCLDAAASHATQCLGGCNGTGGSMIVGKPGALYDVYTEKQQLLLAAGLQEEGAYIHGAGPILQAEAYLLDFNEYAADSTTAFLERNWVSVGDLAFDGDSLWQIQVDMSGFPSSAGYLARYDFTVGPGDTTYVWVSSLIPQAAITAVPGEVTLPSPRLFFTPNPTRDRTHIRFHVPRAGPVEVSIHDLFGRRLRSWSWPTLAAGEHQVVWNWESESGQSIPSSVVYCRLSVHKQFVALPMTRLK